MGTSILLYCLMIIPVAALAFCSIKFPKRLNIPERIAIFVIPLIAIVVVKLFSVHTQTRDTEYWNTYAVKAEYFEPYQTYDHETCTREHCTGSGKDRSCWTETYDCSTCDDYGPKWIITDNTGKSYRTNNVHVQQLASKWGNYRKVDLRRDIEYYGGCGKDGDKYVTTFDKVFEHTQPICKQYVYENKVQCSKSLFNFEPVDSADSAFYGLYRYPYYERMGIYNYNPLIGAHHPVAAQRLSRHNAWLGSKKQVHMMLLVFNNQPIAAAHMQEAHWKRGNKNEFILCIGRQNKETQWAYVISWTDKEVLKARVAQKAREMPYDLVKVVDMMAKEVDDGYVRREFEEFSYLTVEPTIKSVLIALAIVIFLTAGICIFSVLNHFDLGGRQFRFRY